MHDEILFWKYDWLDVSEEIKIGACKEADQLPEAVFKKREIAEISAELCKKHLPILPTLDTKNITHNVREIQIDGSRGRMQNFGNDGQQCVKGTAIDFLVPFDGDPEMFKVKPSSYRMSSPRGRVDGKFVIFTISGIALSANEIKTEISSKVAEVEEFLDYLSKSAHGFSEALDKAVVQALEARKLKLIADKELIAGLEFKAE